MLGDAHERQALSSSHNITGRRLLEIGQHAWIGSGSRGPAPL